MTSGIVNICFQRLQTTNYEGTNIIYSYCMQISINKELIHIPENIMEKLKITNTLQEQMRKIGGAFGRYTVTLYTQYDVSKKRIVPKSTNLNISDIHVVPENKWPIMKLLKNLIRQLLSYYTKNKFVCSVSTSDGNLKTLVKNLYFDTNVIPIIVQYL